MKYWAFLSYSHTDKKWGDWLHKALETYRVPRRLVGKESRDGKIPERLFPIFRDREELPVSADLGANINEALRESRYLIVICSPRSAQSRWVGEEIKTFKKLGREDRILALIVDGEPNASDGKPGFKIEDECFHEAMRYRMVDGEVSEIRSEPIAADAREGKDGKTNAKLKLLAGLLGVNYDDLKQREQERRLKRARMIAAASVALIAIFAALSVAFFFNARAARRARDEARATLSRSDFLQALRSIDEGKDFDALAQLARSLRFNPNNQAARCRLATLLIYRNYPTSVLVLKHDAVVQSAQFSPDGKKIMAVALDNAVRVWDAETGALVGNPMRHNVYVRSAQFSPDTTKVATVSEDKTVWIWDAQNGSLVTSIKHDQRVWSVQFSPDGKLLLTASPNRAGLEKVQLWDADSGMAVGKPLSAGCAQFSPDGKRIATGSEDGTAQIWDVKTGEALTGPMKHDGSIHSVEFSPNGKRILTVWVAEGGNGWAARAWDAGTGSPVGEVMKHPDDVIVSAHFSPNSKRVVTAMRYNPIKVWDAETGKPLTKPITHGESVSSAQFSRDGRTIVTASADGTARIWDAESGEPFGEPMKHGLGVGSAEFSPDGTKVVTASADGTARVWNVKASEARSQIVTRDSEALPIWSRDSEVLLPVWLGQGGGRLLTKGEDKIARILDIETGKAIGTLQTHDCTIGSAEFSADGKKVVTICSAHLKNPRDYGKNMTAQVWDAETGNPLGEPIKNVHDHDAQFSPEGKRIATVSDDGTARIWNVEIGESLVGPIKDETSIQSVEFSPDGERILTRSLTKLHRFEPKTGLFISGGTYVRVWNAKTGAPSAERINNARIARFSPDGRRIVTAQDDSTARIWDAKTLKPLGKAMTHYGRNLTVEFSPDGKTVLTATIGSARLWDAETGKPLTDQINDSVHSEAFSPDAERFVGGRIWDVRTGRPLSESIESSYSRFNAAGTQLVTVGPAVEGIDRGVRIWDVMPVAKSLPEWMPDLADAVAGEHLNDQGVFERLQDSAHLLKQIREQLNREFPANDWVTWGRWFLADRSTRTISPFSKITVPEYIENRIKENTVESLDEAEQLAVGNPELLKRIAQAKQSLPPKREQENKENEDGD